MYLLALMAEIPRHGLGMSLGDTIPALSGATHAADFSLLKTRSNPLVGPAS